MEGESRRPPNTELGKNSDSMVEVFLSERLKIEVPDSEELVVFCLQISGLIVEGGRGMSAGSLRRESAIYIVLVNGYTHTSSAREET